MTLFAVDISSHQGAFDVVRAAAEGYSACLCKATEGRTFRDPRFDRNIPLVKASGMVPGAYHFLRSGDGAAQARAFHARIAAHGGPAGWLCACDNEADASWSTTMAFFAEWGQLTGCHPLIMYSGAWWWGSRHWPGATLTPHLWHSRYTTGTGPGQQLYTRVPASWWTPGYGGWPTATLLQFTSSARVAGQSVDASAFRGTVDDLLELTHGGTVSQHTDQILEAWAQGVPVDAAGRSVEPVKWRMRDEDWQQRVEAALSEVLGRPAGAVVLTEADRSAIAAEVASLLAPQLRGVAQLAERLGAAGDVLGQLND